MSLLMILGNCGHFFCCYFTLFLSQQAIIIAYLAVNGLHSDQTELQTKPHYNGFTWKNQLEHDV